MSTDAKTLLGLVAPESMAKHIVDMWSTYKNARVPWETEVAEIRDFLYATDTRHTQVGNLPFKNSTTIPKLSQIATNLMANYSAHLFSDPDWAQWEAFDEEAAAKEQRMTVEAYTRDKVRRKKYQQVFLKCLQDWVNSGVCFARQSYVTEQGKDRAGNAKVLYQGAQLQRISPMDIVFDVTAADFDKAAKVIRSVYSLGDIARDIQENPDTFFDMQMLDDMRNRRIAVRSSGIAKVPEGIDYKGTGLNKQGLGDILNYLSEDLVEVHEFFGSLYDIETGEYRQNHHIVVVDRKMVVKDEAITSENGSHGIYYSAWEQRPDSLMGMSPLARIVGLQYKVDKLENLRADVFDQMANPPTVEKGNVQFYGKRGAPGSKYVVDDTDGDVRYLVLPGDALNADFQIDNTMNIMEQMAGSPQNASGFRTPGEKTKFEVQHLDQGANRIFRNRTEQFEAEFLEPVLADIVRLGREFIGETDMISSNGGELQTQMFLSVKRADLFVSGKMRARGSKLFAEKANALQNILNVFNSSAGQSIQPHVSTKKMAKAIEQLADLTEFGMITPYIGLQEQLEGQQLAQAGQQQVSTAQAVEAEDELARGENGEDS